MRSMHQRGSDEKVVDVTAAAVAAAVELQERLTKTAKA